VEFAEDSAVQAMHDRRRSFVRHGQRWQTAISRALHIMAFDV